MQTGKVIINGKDLATQLNEKIVAKSTNITTPDGTYGATATSGNSFTIPVVTVENERVSKVTNTTVNLNKSHCTYCTHCTYDNQCQTNT